MSKVKDLIADARSTEVRTAPYLVNQPKNRNDLAYWATGTRPSPAAAYRIPTSPLAANSLSGQIRAALTNYYRYIGQIPSRKSLERNVNQISLNYQDLKKLGFDIHDVTTFGLRHAKALLAKWQSNQCAPNTLYTRWSGLRTWSRALGKHSMLGKITEVQPGVTSRLNSDSRFHAV